MSEVSRTLESWAALGVALMITLCLLYHLALPRPLPGIPNNMAVARSLLWDLPAISSYLGKGHNTLLTYFKHTVISLNAPLAQVFLKPLGAPTLLLADFNEARRMLMRPKEFDRSSVLRDLVLGLVLDHQIHLETDAVWRAQRRQIQDLMSLDNSCLTSTSVEAIAPHNGLQKQGCSVDQGLVDTTDDHYPSASFASAIWASCNQEQLSSAKPSPLDFLSHFSSSPKASHSN